MSKKNILGFAVALVVLFVVIFVAKPGLNSQNNSALILDTASISSNGVLAAEIESYDFGTISMKKGDVKYSLKIKNIGNEAVTIGKIYTSCMCTIASILTNGKKFGPYGMQGHGFIPKVGEIMEPGSEAKVEVVFDPNAHGPAGVGRIERVVIIENSAGRDLEFGFTALVTP